MADHEFNIQSDSPVADQLKFWRIMGHEVLARPSAYELTVLCANEKIDAKDILGRAFDVVIGFADADDGRHERHCQGHAVRFSRVAQVGRFFEYRISLRSWFWLLTKRVNSRILQDKPVLGVLDTVFEDSPIRSLKKIKTSHVIGAHPPHGYCVQYQESDYSFLSRLMEEEGIYYWFDAHDAPGTMQLSDASDLAHARLPANPKLRFVGSDATEGRFNEITRWVSARQFESGKFASRDRDFKVISKELRADKGEPDAHELADLEVFEFPGGYASGDDTDHLARLRLDELIGRRQRHWALTTWPDVAAGASFTFEGDPDGTRNGDYLIGACTFVATHPGYESVSANEPRRPIDSVLHEALDDDPVNEGMREMLDDLIAGTPVLRDGAQGASAFLITVMPLEVAWRPPRLTPRVTMRGPQSAIVTGRSGEQIWTEEHGRVKVQFHWDRYGKNDENSSCWVRVSHPWAGKSWGAVSIPRIGQEVIVDFLDGDPDQPIIVGRFYNGESQAPFGLPAGAVVSGIKSNTHKGKGYNELSMDDTAGKEKITIHGQYDMNTTVEHDQTTTVHNNRTDTIDVDDAESVGNNQKQHVGVNQTVSIGSNRSETVGGTETIVVTGHRTETVNGGETVTVNAGRTHTVNGMQSTTISVAETHTVGAGRMHSVGGGEAITVGAVQAVTVGGAQIVSVGGVQQVSVGALQSFTVGGPHKLSAAAIAETAKGPFKIKAGAVCVIEAPTIMLKAGGSKIVLSDGGITIKGASITIKADGSASFKAGGSIKIKGSNLGED